MSTLLELSTSARSNDLKDLMIVLFESENQKDLITANNMNIVAKNLATCVRERDQLIGELDNCLGSTTANESAKLWREMNDADLAKTRWLDLAYFDHEAHMLDYMLQKQCRVNDSHNDMPLTYYVNRRSLHFGRQKFSLITLFRFGAVSSSCYSKGDMKFKDRVFPQSVGLTITSLDLLSVIEDEEYFRKLCDVDSIRVCLLLCLDVIFIGRLMVNEVDDTLMRLVDSLESRNAFPWGLHKSRNYVPTYTLSGFVWAFKVRILESFERSNRWWNKVAEAIPRGIGWSKKANFKRSDYCTLFCKESNPISDLRPTLAEYKSEWWTSASLSSVKDSIIKRLNSRIFKLKAIIQVLGRERNSDVVEKLKFRTPLDVDTHEEFDETKDYLVKEEFMRRLKEEESILICGWTRCGMWDQTMLIGPCGDSYDLECRDWYIRIRDCLQVRLAEVLELVNVFDKKGIDKSTYHVTFRIAENVPKQGCLW
ncbi:hypothetical protein Tco_1300399 [Tanacetum coccineum]